MEATNLFLQFTMSVSVNKSDQLQLGQIAPVKPVSPKPMLTPLQRLFLSDNQPSLDSSTQNNEDLAEKAKHKESSENGSASSKKGSDRSRSRDKVGTKRTDFVDTQQKFRYYNKSKVNDKKIGVEPSSIINLTDIADEVKVVDPIVSNTQSKPASSVLQGPPVKDARQNYLQIKQAFSGLFQDDQQVSKPNISNTNVSVNNGSHDRFYKTRFCPQFKQGYCQRGQRCTYAHSESELRELVGGLYKTKICYSFERGTCTKGARCGYAHGKAQLRENKQNEQNSRTREKSTHKRRQDNGPSRNNNQRGSQQRQISNNNQRTQKIDYNEHYSANLNHSNFDNKQMHANMPLYPPPYYGAYYPPNGAFMQQSQSQQNSQGLSSVPQGYPNYFFPYFPYYPPQASGSLYPPFPNIPQNVPTQRIQDSSPTNGNYMLSGERMRRNEDMPRLPRNC